MIFHIFFRFATIGDDKIIFHHDHTTRLRLYRVNTVCHWLFRYDGRGHLFDLRPYDADNIEQGGELSADEERIERLCEEERYLELHTDLAEKAIQEGINSCLHVDSGRAHWLLE